MGAETFIGNMLRIAKEDLAGAVTLTSTGNRNAAYLLEQAAEKTIRAVLVSETLHSSIKHELKDFVDLVPDINPVKPLLRSIEHLAQYATTYRYPTSPKGRVKPPPTGAELQADIAKVEVALSEVVRRLGVDLAKPNTPATKAGPIR